LAKQKAVLSWSGGKDSALALYHSLLTGQFEIYYLLSTLDKYSETMRIHGVHASLLEEQSRSIGIPLRKVLIDGKTNQAYEIAMGHELEYLRNEGITHIIFGDIFLVDLRIYRESFLKAYGFTAVFPLFGLSAVKILNDFFELGFEAWFCASNENIIPVLAGNKVTKKIIFGLPEGIDPCGENGEYHCFCSAGPIFSESLNIVAGDPELVTEKLNAEEEYRFWQSQLRLLK